MGVITGLPSILLNNTGELKKFIKSEGNTYIVMRLSDWQQNFSQLPITPQARDTGWKKFSINKNKIWALLEDGLGPHLPKYSENYILLKKGVGK
jgi:hypothetical protein